MSCETPCRIHRTKELDGTFRATAELRKAKQVGQMDSKRQLSELSALERGMDTVQDQDTLKNPL